MRPLPVILILALATSAAHAETIAGRASVIDGDTIEIHSERIRILDIDAPESRQPCIRPDGSEWRCGQQAALALADWMGRVPSRATLTSWTTTSDIWRAVRLMAPTLRPGLRRMAGQCPIEIAATK